MPPQNPTGMADTDSLKLEAACQTYVDQAMSWRDWLESLIERYPWPTVLLAFGVGYVLARRMR